LEIKNAVAVESQNTVVADGGLLPAILNLINNGIRASKANDECKLELSMAIKDKFWQLNIRDFGRGFSDEKLSKLGIELVDSKQGFGMAVFLSNVSLERMGGKLTLTNHVEGGALVTIMLPLNSQINSKISSKQD